MKPIGQRVILKCEIIRTKDADGNEKEEISPEAKVMVSNVPELKKGDTVFFNQYGAISINTLTTKKNMVLVVDAEDIYALL